MNTLICTIGPACERKEILLKLKKAGINIFRINLSHASLEDIRKFKNIADQINIELAIDTEGAQLRTKNWDEKKYFFKKGEKISMRLDGTINENYCINLSPANISRQFIEGDIIRLDFNGLLVKVLNKNNELINYEVISGGFVGNNKGADCLNKRINFSDFTSKDIKALEIAKELGIYKIFISFCQNINSINKIRSLIPNSWICSKIESKQSIHNLKDIAKYSDSILIDRGDLSREISILDIPFSQRGIVKVAKEFDTPCFIATNVLESLIEGDLPTRAELNDIVSSLEMGCSGIVLAAETAIGKKPVLCAEILKELMHKFYLSNAGLLFCDLDRDEITDNEMKIWLNRYGTTRVD